MPQYMYHGGIWGTLPLHHATGITCKIAGVELELYVITPSVQNQRAREDLSGASSPGDIALRSRVPVSGYRFSNFMLRHQSRLVSCRHYYLLDSKSSHRGPGIMVRVTVRVGDPCKASMVLNIGMAACLYLWEDVCTRLESNLSLNPHSLLVMETTLSHCISNVHNIL